MKILRRRPRACILALSAIALGGATLTTGVQEIRASEAVQDWASPQGDFSVLTYNVKGLPEPIVFGRTEMLERIGERLGKMRKAGRQPSVVVLQEAFTAEARRIAQVSGYRHAIPGPGVADKTDAPASAGNSRNRSWMLGETQGPQLDSGLMLLTDLPVVSVRRAAFPRAACAGFDCLANKGVLLVTLDVPGRGHVAVATTHFNSRGASWAPEPHTKAAYKAQADYLSDFLRATWSGDAPLIVAGDFNRGQRPYRMEILPAAMERVSSNGPVTEALAASHAAQMVSSDDADDARWIVGHARDMQFLVPAKGARLAPVAASVPFGSEPDGTSLSDHFGFIVNYAIDREPDDVSSRADITA